MWNQNHHTAAALWTAEFRKAGTSNAKKAVSRYVRFIPSKAISYRLLPLAKKMPPKLVTSEEILRDMNELIVLHMQVTKRKRRV